MNTNKVRIVDLGRGPQIEGHRLTVMDVFYYVHRGHDYEVIKTVMLTLKREEYEAAMEYIREHYDALAAMDARVEERIRKGIEEQKAKGLYFEIDESIPLQTRLAQLKEKMLKWKKEQHDELIAR
jgi:uncharacterized protein (DUF433 family)